MPCSASIFQATGKTLEEALAYAKKAVSLEPGNTEFMYDLAQVLAQTQRFDEAQYVAKRARTNSYNAEYRARLDQFIAYLQNARSIASRNALAQIPRRQPRRFPNPPLPLRWRKASQPKKRTPRAKSPEW